MCPMKSKNGCIAVLLVFAMLFLLTACGPAAKPDDPSKAKTEAQKQSNTDQPASDVTKGAPSSFAPDSSNIVDFEDVTVFDNGQLIIKATKSSFDKMMGCEVLYLSFENKSQDKTFSVGTHRAFLDGFQVITMPWLEEIPPGQTVESSLYMDFSTLKDFLSKDITDIGVDLGIGDAAEDEAAERAQAHVYPLGAAEAGKNKLKEMPNQNVIIDDDMMRVTVLDQGIRGDEYVTSLLVENKTPKRYDFLSRDLTINDKLTNLSWGESILGNSKRIIPFKIETEDLPDLGLSSLADIKTIASKVGMVCMEPGLGVPPYDTKMTTFSLKTSPDAADPASPNTGPNDLFGDKASLQDSGQLIGEWDEILKEDKNNLTIEFKADPSQRVEIRNGDQVITGKWEAYFYPGEHDPHSLFIHIKLDDYDGNDHEFSVLALKDGMLSTGDGRFFKPPAPDAIIIEDYAAAQYANVKASSFEGVWRLDGGICQVDSPPITVPFDEEIFTALGLRVPAYISIHDERIFRNNCEPQSIFSPRSRGEFIKGVLYISNEETERLGFPALPLYIVAPGVIHAVLHQERDGISTETILVMRKVSDDYNDPRFFGQEP